MQIGNAFSNNKFTSSNKFSKQNSILDKRLFDDSKEIINYKLALKSVNLPEHYFCNFFKSKKCDMYKFVKRELSAMKYDNYNVYDRFKLKDVEYTYNLSEDKINDIVFATYGEYKNIKFIYRLKHNDNPAFQLYVNKINLNEYEVLIIDLYHLVIPAADKAKGKKIADIITDYDCVKNYNFCLSNLNK